MAVSVFPGEFLSVSSAQGNNGIYYRINFLCGDEKLKAYAAEDVYHQAQTLQRLAPVTLGIVVKNRPGGGWSGRAVEMKVK